MYQDYYWLNHKAEDFLKKGYLSEGESTKERVKSICDYAETILGIKGFSEKLERYIAKGWISLSSPIWANFAKDRGCPISCFNSFIPDTMNGILTKVAEVGIMTKIGGGTSAYFGGLRPRGAAISAGGASNGPVHFMQLFDKVASVVAQSSVRRGSFAAYLDVEHPDFLEFLKIRSEGNPIQEMSFGACISDAWMNSMIEGDKDKRKTWSEIIKKRFETGYPYLFFTDTINKNKPQVYKDKELKIHSSNLCVTGDTLIDILLGGKDEKRIKIKDLLNYFSDEGEVLVKSYNVFNRTIEYNKILAFAMTGETCNFIEIVDGYGNLLQCTPEHQIYTQNRGYVTAKNLCESDILVSRGSGGPLFDNEISITEYTTNSPVRVFDITVKGARNFYANNILVHNCSEISLPSCDDESFVCDLSSVNLLHYDQWKNTDLIETVIYFLDSVMTDFINKAKNIPYLEAAYNFAIRHRALGLGVLGWHSLLQSKMIPFESLDAKMLNVEIFKLLDKKSMEATKKLASEYGEPEILKGYGQRNTTRLAVAPTTSSSFILGQVSPSIEPLDSNYFVKDLSKGRFTYKNPYLKDVLVAHNKDTPEVWDSILAHGGSVQHLSFLSDNEKSVFKTFGEISQKEVVIQASARQKYIDQAQSLNIMVPLNVKPKEVSDLMIDGWRLGVKTFYYQRGANPAQNLSRSILTCQSCEA